MSTLGTILHDIKVDSASSDTALSTIPEEQLDVEGSQRQRRATSYVGDDSTESVPATTTTSEKEEFHAGVSHESDSSTQLHSTDGEHHLLSDKKRKYKTLYKAMRVAYDNLFEELLATKQELAGTKDLLSNAQLKIRQMCQERLVVDLADRERIELRQMRIAQAELIHDYKAVVKDRDRLFEECIEMKRLLAIKDNEITSLAGNVKLLVQVGMLGNSTRERTNLLR